MNAVARPAVAMATFWERLTDDDDDEKHSRGKILNFENRNNLEIKLETLKNS